MVATQIGLTLLTVWTQFRVKKKQNEKKIYNERKKISVRLKCRMIAQKYLTIIVETIETSNKINFQLYSVIGG